MIETNNWGIDVIGYALALHGAAVGTGEIDGHEHKYVAAIRYRLSHWQEPTRPFDATVRQMLSEAVREWEAYSLVLRDVRERS